MQKMASRWLMQKQLSSSFTQPPSVLTFELVHSFLQWLFHDKKYCGLGNLCNIPGHQCMSFSEGQTQMHATQSQQSVPHMCYQTLTTTGKDQNLPFQMELNASRCPGLTGRKTLMSTYTMLMNTLGRIGKENTRCVFIVPPPLFCCFLKYMNGWSRV